MPNSKLVRALSVSLFALAVGVSGCASGGGEAAKGDGDKGAAKPADQADQPIVGTPVEGEAGQRVATAPGGGEGKKQYALEIESSEAKVGEEGRVSIRVVPQDDWHMNLEYPTKLQITAPAGTTVAKPKLVEADAVTYNADGCEFAVAFTPDQPGDKTFTGEFKFAICQDTACVPKTETLEFKVAVK